MSAAAKPKVKRTRRTATARRSTARPALSVNGDAATPFETFVTGLIEARGGETEPLGGGLYRAKFDPDLARRVERKRAVLVFDAERVNLPEDGVFVAPGSRFGLSLLAAARGQGYATRSHVLPKERLNLKAIAREGFTLHGAEASEPRLGEARWVVQIVYYFTMTLRGGTPEQDPRMVVADARGPVFEFLEPEVRRSWERRAGFPDEPVWWGESEVGAGLPEEAAAALWPQLVEWLRGAQATRLERWRRRCEQGRDKDLQRVNAYYKTRLDEEEERRRRRGDDSDFDEEASEDLLKLEWSRRVRSVRARWQPAATLDLWGIEEIARQRVPVAWRLDTPEGISRLGGEIDVGDGGLVRKACRSCGRLAGEFWWEGSLVCRRCRSRGGTAGRGRKRRSPQVDD